MPLPAIFFIALLLLEIAGFALVGSLAGVLATVALAVATTLAGAVLLRIQGLGALARIRTGLQHGATPGREVVHGVMIALAGLLLVLPGFFTDALGLLLFIAPVRDLVWRVLKSRVVVEPAPGPAGGYGRRGPRTIELDADDFARRDGKAPPAPDDERRTRDGGPGSPG